eukprot:TRINITY_DN2353_c0_g1_i14.p1 TRINITY_DN2353_c0_g1~~TRINITY_DN2353_c0_g1_i14.p1  ORF type:complete len:542 (-),score=61.49 TRINITY_DN2353_c0_g1_i14:2387-4012(-)
MIIANNDKPLPKPSANAPTSFETVLFPKGVTVEKLDATYLCKIYNDFILSLINVNDELKERIMRIRKEFPYETGKLGSLPTSKEVELTVASECEEAKDDSKTTKVTEEDKELTRKAWVEQAKLSVDTETLTASLISEIHVWANAILQVWNQYLEVIILVPHQLSEMLRKEFNKEKAACLSQFVHHSETKVSMFPFLATRDASTEHQTLVKVIRGSIMAKGISSLYVKERSLFGKLDEVPILFEEVFMKDSLAETKSAGDSTKQDGEGHLLVFVHGFQGNSYDTRVMKNVMFLRMPSIQTLCSMDNEGNTEGNIQEMGEKLAKEVISYIKEWFPGKSLKKLSFFGHSLGGIIIRAALPLLAEYKDKMHMFLTFSSPHLGCMYQSSKLVGAGMWFLKKWKTSKCLEQLEMTDHKDYTQTFLYKLSESEGLEWFKHVLLFSSFLDYYSPYDSSRIEIYKKVKSGSVRESVYMKMASNILGRIRANALHRVDVAFNIKKSSINSFIGREAHLQFLENEVLMKLIAYRYANLLTQQHHYSNAQRVV